MQALSQLSYGPTAGKRGSLAAAAPERQAKTWANARDPSIFKRWFICIVGKIHAASEAARPRSRKAGASECNDKLASGLKDNVALSLPLSVRAQA
jgi:hypothetical protein